MNILNNSNINCGIDFSINGLRTGGLFKNVIITTDPNTAQNSSQLIDLVIRIELTRAISMKTILKFSEKLNHPFSYVYIWYHMFPESHEFVAVPVQG